MDEKPVAMDIIGADPKILRRLGNSTDRIP